MSGIYKDDRPALLVLGVVLATIVVVSLLGLWSRQSLNRQAAAPNAASLENYQEHRGPTEGYWWPEVAARDTYAQWIMSALAFIATGTGILGLVWIRQTLVATQVTARAAVEANSINRDMLYASHRPYLVIDTIVAKRLEVGDLSFWSVEITVTNTSEAPAMDVCCVAEFRQEIDVLEHNLGAIRLSEHFGQPDNAGMVVRPLTSANLTHVFGQGPPTYVEGNGWTMIVCIRFRSAVGPKHFYFGCKGISDPRSARSFASGVWNELHFVPIDVSTFAT